MSRKPNKAGNGQGCLARRRKKVNGKWRAYGSYRSQFRAPDGKLHRINHKTQDYAKAKKLHDALVAKLVLGQASLDDEKITAHAYVEQWLAVRLAAGSTPGADELRPASAKKYTVMVGHFLRFLRKTGRQYKRLADLSAEDIKAYRTWRLAQTRFGGQSDVPITREGVNREFKFLRGLLLRAFREGLLRGDITLDIKPLKEMRKKAALPTLEDIREVLPVITPPEVRDIVVAHVLTGARSQELFHLTWEAVDLRKRFLHIQPRAEDHDGKAPDWRPKNESSIREVPIADDLFAILDRLRNERPDARPGDTVFLMPPCEGYPEPRPFHAYPNFAYRKLKRAINTANRTRRRAGREDRIPVFNLRMLRHFFISWSLTRAEHRLTELEVIAIVGHVDLAMLKKTYFHADFQGCKRRSKSAAVGGAVEKCGTLYNP